MTPTPEQLAAFADDQLTGAEHAAVAEAIAADPALGQQVAAHRALKARLAERFAPIAHEPVPDRLAAMLMPRDTVVDFAAARTKRRGVKPWGWLAGPALAASLVLALSLKPADPTGYAEGELAAALDSQLVGQQGPDAKVRVLLSFREAGGGYCRAFESGSEAAIACRDARGWKLRTTGAAGEKGGAGNDFRQAASAGEVLATAQAMAAGPALDAQAEVAARRNGWLER